MSIILKDRPLPINDMFIFTQLLNLLYSISVKMMSPSLIACQLLLYAIKKGQCKHVKTLWVFEP